MVNNCIKSQLSNQAKTFSETQRSRSQLLNPCAGTSKRQLGFQSGQDFQALLRTSLVVQPLWKPPFGCVAMGVRQPAVDTGIGTCWWHAGVMWVVPMSAIWRNLYSSLVALCLAARFWLGFCLLSPPPPPSILIPFHCFHPAVVFDLLSSLLVSSLRTCACRERKTEWNIRLHVTMIKRHVRKPRLSF